jgi:cellulose synthase/poly-beta-1,6-N-acetylglucosamine synthase-like glycosyltransferase
VERQDAARRGKGFALAAGIEFLKDAPPAVVVVIDADMRLGAGSIDALVAAVVRHAAPAQALDLLEPPAHAPMRVQVSALAFFFKNHVRALGAEVLGIPCLLRGTGMAFPWKLISGAALATDNLVEDMQLGMDLALAGHAPRFCPAARVTGQVPAETAAAAVQRTRWEHGHLQTILRNVPRLVGQGLKRQRPGLIGLAFDLAVPPLALLVILWCVVALAAGALWAAGLAGIAPLGALAAVGGLLAASILAGWARFARHILPPRTLLSIPFYVLWKVPLYLAFVWKRQHSWIRTERAT